MLLSGGLCQEHELLARLIAKLKDQADGAGPFDDHMTGWGYHETEFAYRAEAAGAACVYDIDCGVYHPAHNPRDEVEYRGVHRTRYRPKTASRTLITSAGSTD